MDLLVVLFAFSVALSEGFSTALANGTWRRLFMANGEPVDANLANGGLMLFGELTTVVVPYMLGKLLIEQGNADDEPARIPLIRRVVVLLAVVSGISVVDFFTGKSSWQTVFIRLFGGTASNWPQQMRWGFGRIAGPFGHAILAGTILLMGLIYCLWLRSHVPEWGTRRVIGGLPLTFRGLVMWALVGGLLMTQSRGPWVGAWLALLLVVLMQRYSTWKAAALFGLVAAVFFVAAYIYGKQYTEVQRTAAVDDEQRNAIYRRELLDSYKPIVKERKAFGWGITTYPAMNGQTSIDNEYLRLAVTQGFVGLGLFVAIGAGSMLRLLKLATQPIAMEDRALIVAHLAALIGVMTTITTVFLGQQAIVLFFLVVGWGQGMNPQRVGETVLNRRIPQFQFQRVLT
jgi:O-antigen ligase